MKRAFLLIVVPALLVALGFAQTPVASINNDQTNIKGCLGGSDGNYTVAEDNTGHIFKIAGSSVDLKPHLGHDVTLIGHRASGVSSNAADNSFAVTELNMISEHCAVAPAAAVAAAPSATVSTPSEPTSTPAAAPAAPAATIGTPAETVVTPAVAATPPAETVATPAAAATPPGETAVTPAAAAAAPAAHRTQVPASPRRSATPAAAATTPAATASTSSEPVSTPGAAAYTPAATDSTSSETVSTPAAVGAKTTVTARGGSLFLLISFVVLVIVIGTLAPSLSRWRRRKILERTGVQNLSFTHEASSDQGKSDHPHKAA
jgi:hypothetical protein